MILSFKSYLTEVFDKESIERTPVVYYSARNDSFNVYGGHQRKSRVHTYSYPTFLDFKRLHDDIRLATERGEHGLADHSKHVLENIYSPEFKRHHSGHVSIEESPQRHGVADVSFHEGGDFARYGDYPFVPMGDSHPLYGRNNLPAAAALHTFRHVAAAVKHFTTLPTREWTKRDEYDDDKILDVSDPFKVTNPGEDGGYIFKGGTKDPRKDDFYKLVSRMVQGGKGGFDNYEGETQHMHRLIKPALRRPIGKIPEGP